MIDDHWPHQEHDLERTGLRVEYNADQLKNIHIFHCP